MDFSTYIEEIKRKKYQENISEIRTQINDKYFITKINNFIERTGVGDLKTIQAQIMNDDVMAAHFCKQPSRQNIGENSIKKLFSNILIKLPSGGEGCVRFTDDGEMTSSDAVGATSSADFLYGEYYATQKFTRISGGNQDRQRDDVIDFLKRGSIFYKVAAIVDGPYWDKYRPILKQMFANNPNVLITSVTEISKNI